MAGQLLSEDLELQLLYNKVSYSSRHKLRAIRCLTLFLISGISSWSSLISSWYFFTCSDSGLSVGNTIYKVWWKKIIRSAIVLILLNQWSYFLLFTNSYCKMRNVVLVQIWQASRYARDEGRKYKITWAKTVTMCFGSGMRWQGLETCDN